MVLDPLTALGLAASVIQFIDFGIRVLSKSHELHTSRTGQLLEHQEINVATRRLEGLQSGILEFLQRTSSENTVSEKALKEVANECLTIGQKFHDGLQAFVAQPGQSTWKSLRQAFKATWNKDGVELMQRRLSQQREQLVVHLLVVICERQDKDFRKLDLQSSTLEARILRAIRDIDRELRADLKNLIQWNKSLKVRNQEVIFARDIANWRTSHADYVHKLSEEVAQQFSPPTAEQIAGTIIYTLDFPQIRDRKLQLESRPAYPKTFMWIFDKESNSGTHDSNFAQWLEETQDSNHLFWVTGRPGSGKSTLMHFLSEAPETQAAIESWKSDHVLLTASSFFWLPGSSIQKSLNGLLRSLLHDLLFQEPSLATNIAQWRWRAYTYGATNLPDWSNTELMKSCQSLVLATIASHRIFLLVDGLDEYDATFAEQVDLVDFLKALANHPNVKICVSSRPWPVFDSAFGTCPHFRLEELTRGDISMYVDGKFAQVREFEDIRALYPDGCQKLVDQVVEKAHGVFLWVYLVTLSLSQGVVEGDSMQQLWVRLDEIPSDLEKYFRQIILAIPEQHRPIAASYFNIMMATDYPVSLLSLSFLEESDPNFLQLIPFQPVSLELLEARKRSMARRLESRCRGLLQVSERPGTGCFRNKYVDYLHRTVREFLLSKEIQKILEEFSSRPLDPFLFLCQSVLAQLKMIKNEHYDPNLYHLFVDFFTYARELECTSGSANISLTEAFFALAHEHLLQNDRDRGRYGSVGSIIRVAIHWDLPEFAKAKIESSQFDVNKRYVFHPGMSRRVDGRGDGASLLLDACSKSRTLSTTTGRSSTRVLDTVIAALFAKGAKPNLETDRISAWEETAWEEFLRRAHETTGPRDGSWLRAAQQFVQHGAAATARFPNVHKATQRDIAEVLEELFPGRDGRRLAEELRARTRVTSRVKRFFFTSSSRGQRIENQPPAL